LRHKRSFRDGLITLDDEITQHRVIEPEGTNELIERRFAALQIEHQVMGLMDLINGMGELAASPVFFAMDLAFGAFNHAPVAFHHGGDLLALVRMDQKHDLVVSQRIGSLRVVASRIVPVRQGVTNCLSATSYARAGAGSSVATTKTAGFNLPIELK